jgi:hypothetical protein
MIRNLKEDSARWIAFLDTRKSWISMLSRLLCFNFTCLIDSEQGSDSHFRIQPLIYSKRAGNHYVLLFKRNSREMQKKLRAARTTMPWASVGLRVSEPAHGIRLAARLQQTLFQCTLPCHLLREPMIVVGQVTVTLRVLNRNASHLCLWIHYVARPI